jgi:hypothetical protein
LVQATTANRERCEPPPTTRRRREETSARREDARASTASKREDELEKAFDKLERETPDFVTRAISWLHRPEARSVRLPVGIVCIVASFFWFLPVIGIELLPIGLLLIAQDVPVLRRPVGRMTLGVLNRWVRLRKWWKK